MSVFSCPAARPVGRLTAIAPLPFAEQMTVDWDEELRKLNASQYGKRQERDLTKDMNDPEAVKWARKNAKMAQSAVEKSTNQVIVSSRSPPKHVTRRTYARVRYDTLHELGAGRNDWAPSVAVLPRIATCLPDLPLIFVSPDAELRRVGALQRLADSLLRHIAFSLRTGIYGLQSSAALPDQRVGVVAVARGQHRLQV